MRVCMCVAHTRTLLFFLITSTGGKHRVKRLRASRPVVVMILTNGEQMARRRATVPASGGRGANP